MQFPNQVARRRYFHACASAALAGLVLLGTTAAYGQDSSADNSAKNTQHQLTADQQSNANTDRLLTAKIRKSLVADKALSMYAHNIKIITQNGTVTLKGPVKSEDEKQQVASKAAEAAGGPDKVDNQLTIKGQS
jgi:hyperosmotically inducible periplasmic protein